MARISKQAVRDLRKAREAMEWAEVFAGPAPEGVHEAINKVDGWLREIEEGAMTGDQATRARIVEMGGWPIRG